MNASKKLFIALVASVLSTGAIAQTDLIGTVVPAGNGATLELGFSSEQAIQGMQFDINAPKGMSFGKARLDGCLGALPKAFSGSTCTVINDRTLRVVVLSLSGAEVPDGFIGRIILPGVPAFASGSGAKVGLSRDMASGPAVDFGGLTFSNVIMGGKGGERIEVDFAEIAVGN